MKRTIVAIESAGFWILELRESERVLGYWCGGLRAWVSVESDADFTLWHTGESASVYWARNLDYLLSARVIP